MLRIARRLTTQAYHGHADMALESILQSYEVLADTHGDVDADLGQGVLTIRVPPAGTYVINKQPPNKQIWLSSPLSGPKRYDWKDGKWVYLRDDSTLGALLKHETQKTLETELDLDLD